MICCHLLPAVEWFFMISSRVETAAEWRLLLWSDGRTTEIQLEDPDKPAVLEKKTTTQSTQTTKYTSILGAILFYFNQPSQLLLHIMETGYSAPPWTTVGFIHIQGAAFTPTFPASSNKPPEDFLWPFLVNSLSIDHWQVSTLTIWRCLPDFALAAIFADQRQRGAQASWG